MNIEKFETRLLKSRYIVGLGAGLLLSIYTTIFFVDFLNIFNLRQFYSGLNVPLLWDFLFMERSLVEMFQWLFLGLFAVTSAYLAGKLEERERSNEAAFWLLFSVAGILMLMEDAGNIRHFILRDHIVLGWNIMQGLETIYFLLLAGTPIIAVLKYGEHIKDSNKTKILVALGFIFYGLAVFFSGPADLTDTNRIIGDAFYETTVSIGGEELQQIYEDTDTKLEEQAGGEGFMDIRYRFVDHLIEESLELLGATMLFASTASYLEYIRRNREKI